ncbi:HU family DNA-binding protein [Nitratidesulfovibrio vulgaris]|uniref:Integration host factor, beta subunit n=2 Tax=Nitratidesulfovibrio vulgaris TaxID=881 RepID=Q726Y3_NITV2|nr:HU family DNA-binding protein [Nitratidesulfovibrio vulgaris]GEB80326.1 integration host factor subunit beta [Desulfovibrio desulfuricans]HBW16359.1 integration host factor subunit beta [Desulfovibrio sp.]AAS97444.1 integration host factor, beta subunit [Nitratidesulfovibrio vulgaris str. Hildenborough]ABM27420.1 histone family protein DNA-binding protein [Nitratidesulfovibrio vulgaris DP4]ADP87888.1 histone family protein DNA-binding protein [Nitratidesulfovibrio vulgaris RCH1]
MNKSELVKMLAENHEIPAEESSVIVNLFFDSVRDALLQGDRVEIRGFGSFKVKGYRGYKGRNPKTGDNVEVPPKRLPVFRAGKELKEIINP